MLKNSERGFPLVAVVVAFVRWPLRPWRRLVCLALMVACFSGLRVALAEGEPRTSDDAIKAEYLYNFLKFVQWPASHLQPHAPLKVCVVGDHLLTAEVAAIGNYAAMGHDIDVITGMRHEEAQQCHMVYFCSNYLEQKGAQAVLASFADSPIVTVGDSPDVARMGGLLGFVKRDGMMRYVVNRSAAERAGLKISGKLMEVAVDVY